MDADSIRRFKRRSPDASPDLISDLPRDVLDGIMERLPLRDAARMCVLSHKWRDIWTSTPRLAFDAHFFTTVLRNKLHVTHEFCAIVSKILFQHEGPILKFSLYVPRLKSCPDVNQWISYLSRNGIRDFGLQNQYRMPFKFSSHLFSCCHLERLELHHCVLGPNFRRFEKLKTLELDRVTIRGGVFEDLISSCPLLQRLSVTNFMYMEHIIIDAPNLRNLILNGIFRSLDVKHAENLVRAYIGLQKMVKLRHKATLHDLIKVLLNSCKIKKLCFGGHFCKVLFKECCLPTPCVKLRNLELLSIHLDDLDDFSSTIGSIQSFLNIVKLNISVKSSKNLDANMLDYNPDLMLHCLRCANVGICSASIVELKVIEFLLACSPILEKLSITSTAPIKKSFRSRMVMQLIRFRRASKKVEVICPEPIISPVNCVCVSDGGSGLDSSSSSEGVNESDSSSLSEPSDE